MNRPQNECSGLLAFRSPEWQAKVDAELAAREAINAQRLPKIPTPEQLAETVRQVKARHQNPFGRK